MAINQTRDPSQYCKWTSVCVWGGGWVARGGGVWEVCFCGGGGGGGGGGG